MSRQRLIWTALPNGVDVEKNAIRLSVFISPFLLEATELRHSPDFLDWPAAVKSMQFTIHFKDNGRHQTFKTGKDGVTIVSKPDSDSWRRLFPSSMAVEPHTDESLNQHFKSFASYQIQTYPADKVWSYLRRLYEEVAYPLKALEVLPLAEDLLNVIDRYLYLERDIPGFLNGASGEEISDAEKQFRAVEDFHTWRKVDRKGKKSGVPEPVEELSKPSLGFHGRVSVLGSYPFLLRKLGLVVDIQIPNTNKLTIPNVGRVWVEPVVSSPSRRDVLPETAYTFIRSQDRFYVQDRVPIAKHGRLLLMDNDKQGFSLIQGDIDAASIKIINLIEQLRRLLAESAEREYGSISVREQRLENPNSSLPVLQSSGISLVRRDKELLEDQLNANAPLTSGRGLDLQDVILGFRADVWDNESNCWRSLCLRDGRYILPGIKPLTLTHIDEGIISEVMTTWPSHDFDDFNPPRFYLHPALFNWQGWGLCVPRPGKVLGQDSTLFGAEPNGGDPKLDLAVQFQPKQGSLPRLRFGRMYKVRMRIVDLAGNSLSLMEANNYSDSGAPDVEAQIHYQRFEPLNYPLVLMGPNQKPHTALGESLDRVVIRSNYNRSVPEYAERSSEYGHNYVEVAQRYIAPPEVSQQMAERHGQFDSVVTSDGTQKSIVDSDAYRVILSRQGTYDEQVQPSIANSVPYLPDPIAVGASLRISRLDAPRRSAPLEQIIPFPVGAWPDFRPFVIQLKEQKEAIAANVVGPEAVKEKAMAEWDEAGRVLTIYLDKAGMYTVRLSSTFMETAVAFDSAGERLSLMGIWNWLYELGKDAIKLDSAAAGKYWMLSPNRTLTLVHAVQQPLEEPVFAANTATSKKRLIGDTISYLSGEIVGNWNSTATLDIEAEWVDVIDDLAEDEPRPKPSADSLHQVTDIAYDALSVKVEDILHDFRDTKYHHVNYKITGTTRFKEHFEEGPYTRTSHNHVDVLSSRRPDPPTVLYCMPAFGWEDREQPDGSVVSNRMGGMLRVYLDRPWYSSGNGERLGVVLSRYPTGSISEADRNYISQWGQDPIWKSATLGPLPASSEIELTFPRAKEIGRDLSIEEDSEITVNVAGHEVHYDKNRRVWYADIHIAGVKNYFPFVRLALARYQPNSCENAHLSRICLTNFIQVAPDRTATIMVPKHSPSAGDRKVKITVAGPGPHASSLPISTSQTSPNILEISFEERDALSDNDLDWRALATVQPHEVLGIIDEKAESVTWSAELSIPKPGNGRELRLVLQEYEQFKLHGDRAKRLVYAHTLELSST